MSSSSSVAASTSQVRLELRSGGPDQDLVQCYARFTLLASVVLGEPILSLFFFSSEATLYIG